MFYSQLSNPTKDRRPSVSGTVAAAAGMAASFLLAACTAPGLSGEHPASGIARRTGFKSGERRAPLEFSWPPGIRGGSLTENEAITVALWNNPDFQAALAGLGLARADVIKAGQLPNPALGLLLANSSSALELTAAVPVDAMWLRPLRVKAAQLDAESVAENLTLGGLDVIRNVRVACAAVELAQKRRRHADESAASFSGMASVAEARRAAGETGEVEPSQARAEASVSQQEVQRLAYEEKLALENLRSLLGLSSRGEAVTLRGLAPLRAGSPRPAGALVSEALVSRPDVRAAELKVMAAGVRARLAKAEILSLTAAGKYTDGSGTQGGVDGALPVLNQNQAGRALADAQIVQALRQLNAVRERAAAEVRSARVKYEQARAVSGGWEETLPALRSAVEKARRSVELGEANQLVALDAARRLADAQGKAAESEARLREARAELEHAVGKSLP